MKNRKSLKLLILALSLALLIGAAVGIAASAADEDLSVDIIAHNVEYGETINVLFAVDNTNTDGKAVEIVYYLDDPDVNPDATPYIGSSYAKGYTEEGTTYPAFVTAGFPIKEIWRPVYAKAHIVGTDVYSDTLKYSVTQYLNERLYLATGVSENKLAFYASMLETATLAQKVLINENTDPSDDIDVGYFVSDHSLVTIAGGTLDGAGALGMYFKGESVTPYADGVQMWNAKTYAADGTYTTKVVKNGSQFAVAGRTELTVNNDGIQTFYDKYLDIGDGKTHYYSYDVSTQNTAQNLGSNGYMSRSNTSISYGQETLTTNGEYIRVESSEFSAESYKNVLEFGRGSAATFKGEGFYFRNASAVVNNKQRRQVFETKIKLNFDETAVNTLLENGENQIINFNIAYSGRYTAITADTLAYNHNGSSFAGIFASKDAEGNLHYYFASTAVDSATQTSAVCELSSDWATITSVIELTTGMVKYYINGCFIGEYKAISDEDVTNIANNQFCPTSATAYSPLPNGVRVSFTNNTFANSSIYLDDTFACFVDYAS